jgi:hypothetical protein
MKRRAIALPLLAAPVLCTCLLRGRGGEELAQPLAFNHALHAEQDLGCLDCHTEADKGTYATLPRVKTCLLCHSEPQGEHPDEPKVRAFAEDPGAIPWVQVNRVAGHVYFSHEAHVRWGGMECAECHAADGEPRRPPDHGALHGMPRRARRQQRLPHLPQVTP